MKAYVLPKRRLNETHTSLYFQNNIPKFQTSKNFNIEFFPVDHFYHTWSSVNANAYFNTHLLCAARIFLIKVKFYSSSHLRNPRNTLQILAGKKKRVVPQ